MGAGKRRKKFIYKNRRMKNRLTYLTSKYETQKKGDRELSITKENDVQKIRISRLLKEKPVEIIYLG